jgi:excisionase family DNA binding protein
MSSRLVDARVVAEHLGVPVSWVREQTRRGALPCVALGRSRRYRLDEIDAWVTTMTRQPSAPLKKCVL